MSRPSRTQARTHFITGTLPVSSGSSFATIPGLRDLQHVLDEMGSSIRRLNNFDDVSSNWWEAPAVFKPMGSENKFVLLSNQTLHVSGAGYFGGDLRVESDNNTHALFVDTSNDSVYFGANSGAGSDNNFWVSGSTGSAKTTTVGTSVFGGDLVVSGALYSNTLAYETNNLVISASTHGLYFIDGNIQSSTWTDKTKGIRLSNNATEWSDMVGQGFTSILGAVLSGRSYQKVSGTIGGGGLAAGTGTGLSFNVSIISGVARSKRVDVFLNGVLMITGSSGELAASDADYQLDVSGGEAACDIIFGMDLDPDDIVTVKVQ